MTTRDEEGTEWTQTFGPDNRLELVTDAGNGIGTDTWTFTYYEMVFALSRRNQRQDRPEGDPVAGTTTSFLFGGLYEVALDSQAIAADQKGKAGRIGSLDFARYKQNVIHGIKGGTRPRPAIIQELYSLLSQFRAGLIIHNRVQ